MRNTRNLMLAAAMVALASSGPGFAVAQRTGRESGPPELSRFSRGGKVKAQWKRETGKGKR